jgi:hypothetical protein
MGSAQTATGIAWNLNRLGSGRVLRLGWIEPGGNQSGRKDLDGRTRFPEMSGSASFQNDVHVSVTVLDSGATTPVRFYTQTDTMEGERQKPKDPLREMRVSESSYRREDND